MFFLTLLRIPAIPALLIPEALAAVYVYYDSRTLSLKYSEEWERAELASPFWIGVTALIFAPLGLPFYMYQLRALNNTLKGSAEAS